MRSAGTAYLDAASSRAAMLTFGERYVASTLSGEPTAPSIALRVCARARAPHLRRMARLSVGRSVAQTRPHRPTFPFPFPLSVSHFPVSLNLRSTEESKVRTARPAAGRFVCVCAQAACVFVCESPIHGRLRAHARVRMRG